MASGSKPKGGRGESLPGIRPLTAEEYQQLLDRDPEYRESEEFRKRLWEKYGLVDDSTVLIREDRER